MDADKGKFQYNGLQFVYDMELVDDPQLINNLKLNIFSISGYVREVELLSSFQHRQMLVYVELSWVGRMFFKNVIVTGVTERVQSLLPRFKIRVITDHAILDLALERVKAALTGGKSNAKISEPNVVAPSEPVVGNGELQAQSNLLQHPQAEAVDESNGGTGTVELHSEVLAPVRNKP